MTKEAESIFDIIDGSDISEYELALSAGVSRSTINSWRNRNIQPNTNSLKKVCQALGISLSKIAGDDKSSNSEASPKADELDEKKKELLTINVLGKELVDDDKGEYAIAFMKFLKNEDDLKPDKGPDVTSTKPEPKKTIT